VQRFLNLSHLSPTRALCLCLGVGFLLCLPGLQLGLVADDYMHIAVLEKILPIGGPLDLFDWAPGNPEAIQPRIAHGPYPWTTDPNVRVVFFRPLSSALIALDHALFRNCVPLQHAHSMIWYGLIILACHLLFRRSLPGTVAFLALLLFAMDESHLFAAVWLANRNALVAAVPALFGLCAHVRWREDGWKPGLPLSLLGYAVGLLGGETALGALAYLAAYELFAGPGRRSRRLSASLPATGLVLVYLAVYKTLGYGAMGSGFYIDPIGEPWKYLSQAPFRMVALIGAQLVGFPADLWAVGWFMHPVSVLSGLAGIALIAVLLKSNWSLVTEGERRLLSWMVPGTALSMLPVAATVPTSRLLLVPSVGVSVLLAVVLHAWWQARKSAFLRRGHAAACWFLVVVHLLLPAAAWPTASMGFAMIAKKVERDAMSPQTDAAMAGASRYVLLVAPDPMVNVYIPIMRAVKRHEPMPEGWLIVSPCPCPHRVRRTAPNRLEMEIIGGSIGNQLADFLFSNGDHPFRVGHKVEVAGAVITVLEANDIGPTRFAVEFDRPLEDPALRFLSAKNGYLERMTVPAVGEEVVIPAQWSLISSLGRP
jgi:hypothetical protein